MELRKKDDRTKYIKPEGQNLNVLVPRALKDLSRVDKINVVSGGSCLLLD